MSNITLIVIIAIVLIAAFVIFSHLHKRHIKFSPETLAKAVDNVFGNKDTLSKEEFILGIEHTLYCNRKEAKVLLGRAQANNMVSRDHDTISRINH